MSERSPLRYVAGALAFVAVLAVAIAVLAGWCYVLFTRIMPWVDQQLWIVQFPLKCVLGLTLVFGTVFGWHCARAAWRHFVGAPEVPGETHGRHAKWHPGYDPARGAETDGQHGACPHCGFGHAWDGTRCGHCKFGE